MLKKARFYFMNLKKSCPLNSNDSRTNGTTSFDYLLLSMLCLFFLYVLYITKECTFQSNLYLFLL